MAFEVIASCIKGLEEISQLEIKELTKQQGYIRISQVQKLFNLHEASARRRISRLLKEEILIRKYRGFYEAL